MQVEPVVDPDASLWAWLAYDLRFYRKKHGLSQEAMAKIIGRSSANLSNCEAGRRRITEKEAKALDVYFDTGGHFQRLMRFAQRGHDPDWFKQYVSFERKASVIKTYQPQSVPGLLQVPEYAEELFLAGGAEEAEAEFLVAERMARQAILTGKDKPTLWVILAETVINWTIGSPDVMRKQLAHLLEAGSGPWVGLRIVPQTAGAHMGVDGGFSLISGEFGEVAYTESPGGGRLVSSASEVRKYSVRYDRIGQAALPEKSSREMIKRAMEVL